MKTIKRILVIALSVCFIFAYACGDSDNKEQTVSMDTVKNAINSCEAAKTGMTEVTGKDANAERKFAVFCDMDYSLVDDFYYKYFDEGDIDEVAIVKLKDKNDAAKCLEALHNHLDDRRGTFASYDPDKVTIIDGGIIVRGGDYYCAYFVGEQNGLLEKAFKDCFTAE